MTTMQTALVAQDQPAKPAQRTVNGKKQRISKKLRHAIELLATGEVKYQKDAAARAGLSREHLSRQLQQDHVRAILRARASQTIATASIRAAARMVELLDGDSEHVARDAAAFVLGVEGIGVPKGPQAQVNVNVSAGYVIDWRGEQRQPIVDADATIVQDEKA